MVDLAVPRDIESEVAQLDDVFLYTVDEWNLKLFDISNNQHPVFEKDISVGFGIETIFPYEDKLFLGSDFGMYIFDISAANYPVELSNYQHSSGLK